MTHLPFVAASYTLGVLLPVIYAVAAFQRTRRAARRLASIDTRRPRQRSSLPA